MMAFQKPQSRAAQKARAVFADATIKRATTRLVLLRDGYKCRACARHVDQSLDMLKRAHLHHIRFKSRGGSDDEANLVTLCAVCHADVHAHRLTVTGNAESTLTFSREERTWHG